MAPAVSSGRTPARGRSDAHRWLIVALAALVVFVLRLTIARSGEIGVGFLFTVPAALASWWFGMRAGWTTAAACFALYAVTVAIQDDFRPAAILVRAAVVAASVIVATELREHVWRLQASEHELDALRQALTPPALPSVPGLEVSVDFVPAEHGVSGDFYLVTNGPGGVNIAIVGDVCGHGPTSARQATFARATMASVAANCSDPAEIFELVNHTLVERWEGESYLTAACVVHDPRAEVVRWSIAGHPSPLRLADLSELPNRGLPLGLFTDARYECTEARFAPPDGLVLFTDGLLDAGTGTERYGEHRLKEALSSAITGATRDLAGAIGDSVRRFAGADVSDDVCILVLRALPLASHT